MVLRLSHLALVCLSLPAQTPSAQPFHIPALSPSISVPPHTTPIFSPSLIWTIRAKTGEASFLCTHPTSCLPFSVIYSPTPSLHSSISLASHTDNPLGLVVDGGVNSALWWCLRVSLRRGCLANWLTHSFLLMETFWVIWCPDSSIDTLNSWLLLCRLAVGRLDPIMLLLCIVVSIS